MGRLQDKVAIITGAGQGIGRHDRDRAPPSRAMPAGKYPGTPRFPNARIDPDDHDLASYDDYSTAARAYNNLERAGISNDDISIIANNGEGWYEKASEPGRIDSDGDGVDDRTEGAATGAGIGGAVGGIAGLLAGLGLLAIPGLGPVVAAGWLVSTAALAVTGGAAGGLIGSLTQHGVDEDDAQAYAEGVRRGGTLVTAQVPEADRRAARRSSTARRSISASAPSCGRSAAGAGSTRKPRPIPPTRSAASANSIAPTYNHRFPQARACPAPAFAFAGAGFFVSGSHDSGGA